MSAIYWDTSALLKIYASESDSSAYIRLLLSCPEEIAISFLHRAEMYYALRNKEQRGEILPGTAETTFESFESHISEGRFFHIPWGNDVAAESRSILDRCLAASPPVPLRTLHGLHLGAMIAAGIRKFVTADARMRDAASPAGLELVEP